MNGYLDKTRHLWQHEYRSELLAGYVTNSNTNVKDYNMQRAEIDANAFGLVVMKNWFGLAPLFQGLDNDVKSKIAKRAKVIEKELFGRGDNMTLKPDEIAYKRKRGNKVINVSKAAAEKEKAAQKRWKKEQTTALNVRLSFSSDADVIAKLSSVNSKSAYMKALIRADIERERKEND